VRFVRGNADRSVGVHLDERGTWVAAQHDAEATSLVHGFGENVVVDVDGLGRTRFVHGSPRSDEECVTPRTPADRVAEFMAGVSERVVVTAHVHVSYDRWVGDVRLVGPGSVGRPYEDEPGARWALLGPDVELRRTVFDRDRVAELFRASGIPLVEQDLDLLLTPPGRDEAVERAEMLVFSG
jgi:predicted phosphodiesterase